MPWWTATLGEAQVSGQLAPDIDVSRLAWFLTAAWYGSQSNSHAESNWLRLPWRLADLLRFVLLPAISSAETADVLRAELERLPERAWQELGETREQWAAAAAPFETRGTGAAPRDPGT